MHMLKIRTPKLASNQQGIAAIFVTTVLIFVIGIIVLSFAQIVRREQRNSLDDQLASQAYYAAESGVNLAQSKGSINKTDCAPDGVNFTATDYNIGQNAQITCLLVSSQLTTLEYGSVGMGSKPFLVNSINGAIAKIYLSWETADATDTTPISNCVAYSAAAGFPPASQWKCKHPVLRFDMIPLSSFSHSDYGAGDQLTAFLYPTTTGSSNVDYNPGIVNTDPADSQVNCSTPPTAPGGVQLRACTAVINIPPPQMWNISSYAMRIQSIYKQANVTVFAVDSSNAVKTLTGGQVLVDVTAKASDVLKRVQARIPAAGSPIPDFAISAGDVCKKYSITSGTTTTNNGGNACDPAL